MTNYRLYTGPTIVQDVAERLRENDSVLVTFIGTQHVYVSAPNADAILDAVGRGRGWTERDVLELRGNA
jgi:hypothetical protein